MQRELLELLVTPYREDQFINSLLDNSSNEIKDDIKKLIENGGTIEKKIELNSDNKWSLFIQTGLLTFKSINSTTYRLSIPNQTIQYFISEKIKSWEKNNIHRYSFFKPVSIATAAILGGMTYGVGGIVIGTAAAYLTPKVVSEIGRSCKRSC